MLKTVAHSEVRPDIHIETNVACKLEGNPEIPVRESLPAEKRWTDPTFKGDRQTLPLKNQTRSKAPDNGIAPLPSQPA